jgi:hypothetical protein
MKDLSLEVDDMVAFKAHMVQAGFAQCDINRLANNGSTELWQGIRVLVTGESIVAPTSFEIGGRSPDKTYVISRRGDTIVVDDRPVTLVRGHTVSTYGDLRKKFVKKTAHPPEEVMEFIVKNLHLMPPSWHLSASEDERWIIFLDTFDPNDDTVRGIYMRQGDAPDVAWWDAGDEIRFGDSDFIALHLETIEE